MTYAIVLSFDDESSFPIYHIFKEFKNKKIGSMLYDPKMKPHITLSTYKNFNTSSAKERLTLFSIENKPFKIQVSSIGYFPVEKSVIFLYRQKIDSNGVLSPDKQALLEKLEHAKKTLPIEFENLEKEKNALLEEQKDIEKAFAIAERKVFPKVRIFIGNQFLDVDETLGPSRFKIVASEVVRVTK